MQLENPEREKIPAQVNGEAVAKIVTQLKEYDTKANAYWRGVAREIEGLNASVLANLDAATAEEAVG